MKRREIYTFKYEISDKTPISLDLSPCQGLVEANSRRQNNTNRQTNRLIHSYTTAYIAIYSHLSGFSGLRDGDNDYFNYSLTMTLWHCGEPAGKHGRWAGTFPRDWLPQNVTKTSGFNEKCYRFEILTWCWDVLHTCWTTNAAMAISCLHRKSMVANKPLTNKLHGSLQAHIPTELYSEYGACTSQECLKQGF